MTCAMLDPTSAASVSSTARCAATHTGVSATLRVGSTSPGIDGPFPGVFIRAPVVERVGDDVEVLARHDGVPVLVRGGRCTVATFHPELSDDSRLHQLFLESIDQQN